MNALIEEHNLILAEAAIVERLRRTGLVELHPSLVHATLVYDDRGRVELEKLWQGYVSIAMAARLPILLTTPTWRANVERVKNAKANPAVNSDCVRFLFDLRESQGPYAEMIKVTGASKHSLAWEERK